MALTMDHKRDSDSDKGRGVGGFSFDNEKGEGATHAEHQDNLPGFEDPDAGKSDEERAAIVSKPPQQHHLSS